MSASRISVLAVFVSLAVAPVVAAQQAPAQPPPAAPPAVQLQTYEDSAAGLELQVRDILLAAEAANNPTLYAHARSMLLPGHAAWFAQNFGPHRGAAYAAAYDSRLPLLHLILGRDFTNAAKDGYKQVQVHRFTEACDNTASPRYYPALFGRATAVPLYEIRMLNAEQNKARALAFFAYVDGAFRYLGGLQAAESPFLAVAGDPARRVEVEGSRLVAVTSPPPAYPQPAQDARIEGTVRLWALLGADGSVQDVQLVEGQCWLAEAALAAVRQWRYQPVQQGGRAVEAAAAIDVPFKLPQY